MNQIPVALGSVFAFIIGACVGSFVNVVAYRLPREISIVAPRSMCPNCGHPIPAWANVPVLAYVALRGRCLICRDPIPVRYVFCEVALGLCGFYLFLAFALPGALARFVFCAALLAVSLVDYDWRIIPDGISLPGIPLGVLAATFLMPEIGIEQSLIGVFLGGGVLFIVGEVYRLFRGREGMGMGDVKLMAMVGAFLGWPGVLFTLFFGSLLGSIGGTLVALYTGGAETTASEPGDADNPSAAEASEADRVPFLQTALPFGPYLSAAAALYALFQPQLTRWYFSH